MRSKTSSLFVLLAVSAFLLVPATILAEEEPPERGFVEFGVRYIWGDVYGRPDLQNGPLAAGPTGNPAGTSGCLGCGTPFDPLLKISKYNEYRDLRNGFFIRRFNATFDNMLKSKNYVSLQSQKTLYHDQSYLTSFGQYGRFRIQFRYDEIPHIYTDTARTLFTETSPGVWTFPNTQVRLLLQTTASTQSGARTLPSLVAGTGVFAPGGTSCPLSINCGVVTDFNFLTPSIIRKAGSVLASYNVTPDFNFTAYFWRESQNGLRPIGQIMNSSPSASTSAGYGVELPEAISYFNNLLRVGAEYGKRDWGLQAAYIGSFFQNNISRMIYDNPFNLSGVAGNTPQTGQMDLYPDNQAHYFYGAGAMDLGKWVRVMASASPGWLRQDDGFLPYTTNTGITQPCEDGVGGTQPCAAPPAAVPSLHGDKQTLALNGTLVTLPWKSFQIKAAYHHYDYNNNTPVHTFTPIEGDVFLPNPAEGVLIPAEEDNRTRATSFNRKDLELSGNWYFAKKSSAKVGYEAEWMDRSFRDVNHSLENSIFGAVDVGYWKDLQVRLSYRHSDRKPDFYQDETAADPTTDALIPCTDTTTIGFTEEQRCHRRFDEAARIRDRADGLVIYNVTSKASLSAFGGVIQDNYNRAGEGGNSSTALNFLTGSAATTHPYYLYGILKDISYNYGFGADYAFSKVSLFAEYSHEHYYRRMVSRNRTPVQPSGATIVNCTNGCDTPNNDWESVTPEPVDIWTVGADTYFSKKANFTTYYSLAAGRANTFSRPLGINGTDPSTGVDCSNGATAAIPGFIGGTTPACRFVLVGGSAAVSYPEAVNRQHEVVAIVRYKLSKHLWPKVEYRYQQFDNRDPQTSMMTPYMGCVSPNASPTAAVPGCPVAVVNSTTALNPILSPNGQGTVFYPRFVVGDTSAARYLFLGVDQPSYKAHYIAATLEYHF